MSGIVCAIRGGPHSRPTIDKSIALALETGLPVYFLYIVNLDFLARTTSTRTHTINQEMEQMGEFILLTAQSRAIDQGATAHGRVVHGIVSEEIVKLCNEVSADYLVLGRPQGQKEDENVFTHTMLSAFAQLISEQTGAQVVFPTGHDQ